MTLPWHDGSDIAIEFDEGGVSRPVGDDVEVVDEDDETALTREEAMVLLSSSPTSLGITAAAYGNQHTSGMIALVPSRKDQARLMIPGGEPASELHLTLTYLGDAAKITPTDRDMLVDLVHRSAADTPIVDADGFGIAMWNQDDPEKDTCLVLNVSGKELQFARTMLGFIGQSVLGDRLPEQHEPWLPHITLAYTNDTSLIAQLVQLEGPITFDHVRLAIGGEVTDVPLFGADEDDIMTRPEPVELTAAGMEEFASDRSLRSHWVRGEGAAKIRWGTNGSFDRCVRQLSKYVKNPQGLCAEYHKEATGEWPAEKGVESAVETVVADVEGMNLGEYDGGWEGILMVEDVETGDQRKFSAGSVRWANTQEIVHPLMWAPANNGGHSGAVIVGRINEIWRDETNPRIIRGRGTFNLNDDDGARAFSQVKDGYLAGVSVDPDQIGDAEVELIFPTQLDVNAAPDPFAKPELTVYHGGRIRGATLVAFPAFVEAAIQLTKKADTDIVVASVSTAPWKPIQWESMLDTEIDGLVAAGIFAHVKAPAEVVSRRQCRFLHHELNLDGTVGPANLVACAGHIDAINAGRTFGLDVWELRDAYDHMARHLVDGGQEPQPFGLKLPETITADATSAPPLEWFTDPHLPFATPITVTEDGRVFGHAAAWNSCHTGFADTCVSPPYEPDYSFFTTGEVLTAGGERVAVGQITLGTSHAPTRGLSVAAAIDHYGDTGTAVADVAAGTDDHGIWIAGSVRPGTTPEQLHALRASALSGDWRRIGGNLRMVALLAVNVPGFPIPRLTTAVQGGRQVSLVASGVIDPTTAPVVDFTVELNALSVELGCDAHSKVKKPEYADELAELAAFVITKE